MTARSKVTLVEAQRIRAYLYNVTLAGIEVPGYHEEHAEAIDALLALGLIDTDAALKASEAES